jgi:hypothetical protein
MYNDHLSPEEAKERVEQRMKEVETYSLQKQLGFGDSTATRWLLLLIVILAATGIGLLL